MLNYSVCNRARLRSNINLLDSFFPISWKTLKNINNFSYFVIFIALEKFSNLQNLQYDLRFYLRNCKD